MLSVYRIKNMGWIGGSLGKVGWGHLVKDPVGPVKEKEVFLTIS